MFKAAAFAGMSQISRQNLHLNVPICSLKLGFSKDSISKLIFGKIVSQSGFEIPCHNPNKRLFLKDDRSFGGKLTTCNQKGQMLNFRDLKIGTPSKFRFS